MGALFAKKVPLESYSVLQTQSVKMIASKILNKRSSGHRVCFFPRLVKTYHRIRNYWQKNS